MLDHVSISHKSGLVLWSRSFTPAFSALSNTPNSPVNALFKQSFIEGTTSDGFEKDGYSVRWTVDNGLGLVFVVVFPALLPLTYIPTLLDRTKELFLALFRPYLDSLPSLTLLHAKMAEEKWDLIFDRCLKSCEEKPRTRAVEPSESISAEEIAKNVQHLKSRLKRGKGKTPSPAPSPASKSKLMRKWDDSAISEKDMAALDYSQPTDNIEPVNVDHLVSSEAMGSRGADGSYEVADWDQGRLRSEAEILSATPRAEPESWGGLFSRLAGQKTITKQDLQPVLAEMEKHLMAKNVAKDIAEKLCDAVGTALVGKKLGGLSSVKTQVNNALSASLTRVLTPKTSTDILLDIQRKQKSSLDEPDPYAITFVGVNGVGKSTNLSKVCFWLLQNGLRVLIAACDTFRSGAVEQLRVHVRNLGALSGGGGVELYERGYGKDAAGIAKDAIAYAKSNNFDVVLIDTAGRMQDNEPLMRALAKLVTVNNPDKIVFVGEALVGNEAVDQLSKFDQSLRDFSQKRRGIDGIILTKFDTIDDKVGAALSMTYVTGQPILFVGCGQTYTDLRQLRVNHIVQALLSS